MSEKVSNTAERLKTIMKERNLKQVDIINMAKPFCEKYGVKIGRNDLSQYVSGKVVPGQKKLKLLSDTLNVSEPYLMGYDVPVNADSDNPHNESKHLLLDLSSFRDMNNTLALSEFYNLIPTLFENYLNDIISAKYFDGSKYDKEHIFTKDNDEVLLLTKYRQLDENDKTSIRKYLGKLLKSSKYSDFHNF